ncbi:hypothetical protein [Paenibacillus motobuensis]|uniref:Phage protein n=1 Tax=Paenibacillus motobuensis TaxID=295324 RepID=A0ABN0YKD3_9BACL
MKLRQLLEFTVDISQPLPELSAVISATLSAIPDTEHRVEVLRRLDDEIVAALCALDAAEESEETTEEAAA